MKYKIVLSILMVGALNQNAVVAAEKSANIGLVSQYHFRGIQQTDGPSASAGIDYEANGFSVGSWAADVEDGLEVDVYGGYNFNVNDDFSFFVGATTYQYTGDFDSAYNEVNLSAEYKAFNFGHHIGKWDGEVGNESATEADYTVTTLGYSHAGFSGEIGIYGADSEGEYLDFSYATEIGGFDVSIGLIVSGADLDDDESMYLAFQKTFNLN